MKHYIDLDYAEPKYVRLCNRFGTSTLVTTAIPSFSSIWSTLHGLGMTPSNLFKSTTAAH